jgi:hypothetical protein
MVKQHKITNLVKSLLTLVRGGLQSVPMKVIGLTNSLREDAERRCAVGFRAWLAEVGRICWESWPEVLRFYPNACLAEDEDAHFPLAVDGTGIRATLVFSHGLMILNSIAPAPAALRKTTFSQSTLSHPNNQTQNHATNTTL